MIDHVNDLPQSDQLYQLSELARRLYDAEKRVLELEAELKRARRLRDTIQLTEIPSYLEEVGVTSFSTPDVKVDLEEILVVQPLAANRPLVLQELERQGAGGLIKSTVTVAFDRGQEEKAAELIRSLQVQGMVPKQDRWVEPSTLKKHVRTRLEKGEDIDADLFGVRQLKKATFASGAPEAPVFDDE